ncbi:MAG: hypothetical protein AMXMBFR84_19530 [Candidatus Hydrogenedentota bacterium]
MKAKVLKSIGTLGVVAAVLSAGVFAAPVISGEKAGTCPLAMLGIKSASAKSTDVAAKEEGTCPIEAARAARAAKAEGTCDATKAVNAKAEGTCDATKAVNAKAEGTCDATKAVNAVAAKAEGEAECCAAGAKAVNAVAEGEACEGCPAAKTAAAEGTCDATKAVNAVAENAEGTCPLAAAKLAAGEGTCDATKAVNAVAEKAEGTCEGGACPAGSKTAGAKNLMMTAADNGSFITLLLAAKAAGMCEVLSGEQEVTVLAPVDAAFAKLPAEQFVALLQDTEKLKAVLNNHIIPGKLSSEDIAALASAKNAAGAELAVSNCKVNGLSVGSAKVVQPNLVASNGMIHAIDNVIMPAGMDLAKAETAEATQVALAE